MNALPSEPLPPDTTWTNGKLEQQPRQRSLYDDFTEIERLLAARNSVYDDDAIVTGALLARIAGKLLALKERVCALKPEQRERPKSFRVLVIHQRTNEEVQWFTVEASDLNDAEQRAIAKASLDYRSNPAELVARHVHQLCAACGQIIREGGEF